MQLDTKKKLQLMIKYNHKTILLAVLRINKLSNIDKMVKFQETSDLPRPNQDEIEKLDNRH